VDGHMDNVLMAFLIWNTDMNTLVFHFLDLHAGMEPGMCKDRAIETSHFYNNKGFLAAACFANKILLSAINYKAVR